MKKKVKIYLVPLLDFNYNPAYNIPILCRLYKALVIAFKNNITVAHNGAQFDFLVLAFKYKMPVGRRLKDSMLMMHRCFPTVEKSLNHGISRWTWQQAHKSEGIYSYHNLASAEQLWSYCAKDVFTMLLIKRSIESYAKTVPGLEASIQQANNSIYPYILTSLLGIRYDKEALDNKVAENDLYMTQLLRIMKLLHGDKVPPLISNKNCVAYFHEMLDYPVVSRSKKTKRPSLAEGNLLKLKQRHPDNVVIDTLLKYRQVQKETGVLRFTPWLLHDKNKKC